MVRPIFKDTVTALDKVKKDTNGAVIEKTHNGKKYALVAVENRSQWLFLLKAIGMAYATVYTLGLGCAFKGFRNALVNNWKAVFSEKERKVERYELLPSAKATV